LRSPLPSTGPATIEIFDIAGRSVLRRDVGWMGPGDHQLRLGSGFHPAPGVYTVRLEQGAHHRRRYARFFVR
jgi:hypothetical protein